MKGHGSSDTRATGEPTAGKAAPIGSEPAAERRRGATWRSVLIALLLTPLQSWWIIRMEMIRNNNWPTMLSLPLHTLFILLLLVATNTLLRRRASRWTLSQGELLTVYLMLAIAGSIAGYGQLQSLVTWVAAPMARATPENRWETLFFQYLPHWLVVTDKESIVAFINGQTSFLSPSHLHAWLPAMVSWGGFFLALFVFMLCLNTLLRRRWIEEERLAFPLVQVPLAVTEPAAALFRNRLLWLGFAVASFMALMNGLHALLPAVPSFRLDFSSLNEAALTQRWTFLAAHGGAFWPPYPWAVGVAMLMPLDVSFSYWFFFWFMKLQAFITILLGWNVAPEAPFPYAQAAGAMLTIGAFTLWSARKHFWRALQTSVRPVRKPTAADEPLSYRWAVGLLLLSLAFLVLFVQRAGAPLWFCLMFLSLHLTATLALSRLRAELGAPANELHGVGTHDILTRLAGPGTFPARALTVLTVLGWNSRSYGMDPTPLQMEGFAMAGRTAFSTQGLARAMVITAAAGLVVAYLAVLIPLYRLGADSSKLSFGLLNSGGNAFSQLQSWLTGVPTAPTYQSVAMTGGALLTLFLYAMRSRFLWWPFHPVGYVMAPMWFTHHLWISVFVAWAAKLLLLRYGGMRAYVSALPFALGLVLGDCAVGGIWALADAVLPLPALQVWI